MGSYYRKGMRMARPSVGRGPYDPCTHEFWAYVTMRMCRNLWYWKCIEGGGDSSACEQLEGHDGMLTRGERKSGVGIRGLNFVPEGHRGKLYHSCWPTLPSRAQLHIPQPACQLA